MGGVYLSLSHYFIFFNFILHDLFLQTQGRSQDFFRGTHNSPNAAAPLRLAHSNVLKGQVTGKPKRFYGM